MPTPHTFKEFINKINLIKNTPAPNISTKLEYKDDKKYIIKIEEVNDEDR